MKFNMNNEVKVRLTDLGRDILERQHDELYKLWAGDNKPEYTPPVQDKEGWSKWQLWDLMSRLGGSISIGGRVPFETEIEVIAPND